MRKPFFICLVLIDFLNRLTLARGAGPVCEWAGVWGVRTRCKWMGAWGVRGLVERRVLVRILDLMGVRVLA